MKLTVLGCYGPYPKAKGACSGYLLEDEDTKILIDCGNGVLSRLLEYCPDLNELDGILISHLHPDHMSDLLVLRYAVAIKKMMGNTQKSIDLYLPATPEADYARVQYNQAFDQKVLHDGMEINIKGLKISFQKTDHPIECYAMAFEKDGKKLVYSADTKYHQPLIDFAMKSDLFLCEGGILEKDRTENTPHVSAKQAGEMALAAGVKKLVLTHFYPEVGNEEFLKEAESVFISKVELAEEYKTYII
ncbi:MBL fold metallo-hydrolase [Alkaliphilus transvaalensis]|uniref:MBL fold metallo-hydrolase n=1 Tax=Alkaliphilus transvaalensis TaxID=114628 RepID=UPI00047C4A70|nr:MBL fold metallo-hydrolase [Alkaliphilus transvaalensis]